MRKSRFFPELPTRPGPPQWEVMNLQVIQGEGERKPKEVDNDLLKFIEELLQEVKDGTVSTVALITIVDGEPYISSAGEVDEEVCQIVYGLEQLKYSLLYDEED